MTKQQKQAWATPGLRFGLIIIFALICVAATVQIAISQPRTGLSFEPGMWVEAIEGRFTIESQDLLHEPGEIENQAVLQRFFQRQGELAAIIDSPTVTVNKNGESTVTLPQPGRISHLSFLFWIQAFVAFGALLIAGWIWSLRPRDLATSLFALSALSLLISALPSAVYTTRELALPSRLFQVLEDLNALGAALFGISMIGLFLVYPVRLSKWRFWMTVQTTVFGLWIALFLAGYIPEGFGISLIIVTAMLVICGLIAVQFFATKKDPTSRASLTWLGLSVILGAGAFVGLNTVPLLLKITPLNQGYAFLFFLIIYLGLAAGLTRFRLFEVGQWAFRLLFYAIGALVLVLLDAALVFGIGMDRFPALGLTLLVVGFFYLPLRDMIWRRLTMRGRLQSHELLSEALHVAFASSTTERTQRWHELLQRLFDPLEITTAEHATQQVEIDPSGLTLTVPAVASSPSLLVSMPWGGRGLFNSDSREVARQVVSLIDQAESNRQAYDRGATEERLRMAQDLHDDVGARLLSGLHLADEKLRPTFQAAIADIRDIVSGISGEKVTLTKLLAEIRHETSRRLSAANIELDWTLGESFDESRVLEYRQHKTIRSSVREIVSNVIRHSGAKHLRVDVQLTAKNLTLNFKDNGRGLSTAAIETGKSGYGLKNLNKRLSDIGGSFQFEPSTEGTSVRLIIPCEIVHKTP